MDYSEIIDDILDKVFVETFRNSLNNPPPWFNQFVDWPDIKKVKNNETYSTNILYPYFNDKKRRT